MNKIFTFEFRFVNPETNAPDETQFCAKSLREAEELFRNWLEDDLKISSQPEVLSTQVVFEPDDADYYKDEYGTPDEYYGYSS